METWTKMLKFKRLREQAYDIGVAIYIFSKKDNTLKKTIDVSISNDFYFLEEYFL